MTCPKVLNEFAKDCLLYDNNNREIVSMFQVFLTSVIDV